MFKPRMLQIGLALTTTLLIASGTARAQGVGNLAQLPILIPMNTPNGWNIVDASGGPVPVVLNPQGPAWRKVLSDPNGQAFTAVPGQTFTLHETLRVAGNLPWKDWHEKIVNPNWSWTASTFLVNGAPPPALLTVNNPGNALTGGGINFFFNSIAPGTIVDITKDLTYTGLPGVVFQGFLTVNEFPTPEPASLVLLGLGGLVVSRRRHRTNTL